MINVVIHSIVNLGGNSMGKLTVRQGIIDEIKLQKDYIRLQTENTIFHLPLTTEILYSGAGQSLTLAQLEKGFHFKNYFHNGQHVLVVNEKDSFYGVISGVYDAEKSRIGEELMMRHHEKTIHYGSTLENQTSVIAFCKIMTRSIPPQSTPEAIFVFKK